MEAAAEAPWMDSRRVSGGGESLSPWWLLTMVRFGRKGFVGLGNSLQHGCCSEGPMGRFTPLSLTYQQQSVVLTKAAVEAHMNPSAAWLL